MIVRSGRPTAARLAYIADKYSTGESQLMVWSSQSHNEEPLTASSTAGKVVYDWSADGKWLSGYLEGIATTHRRKSGCCPVAEAPMRNQRRERLFPTQPTISFSRTFLLMADGLSLKPYRVLTRGIQPLRDARFRRTVDSHLGRQALGTTSLAGLPMERRFTSFLPAAASSTCGESASIQLAESQWEKRSV